MAPMPSHCARQLDTRITNVAILSALQRFAWHLVYTRCWGRSAVVAELGRSQLGVVNKHPDVANIGAGWAGLEACAECVEQRERIAACEVLVDI